VGVVLDAGGQVLIDQRLEWGCWAGLWEFPVRQSKEPGEAIKRHDRRELGPRSWGSRGGREERITAGAHLQHKRLRFIRPSSAGWVLR